MSGGPPTRVGKKTTDDGKRVPPDVKVNDLLTAFIQKLGEAAEEGGDVGAGRAKRSAAQNRKRNAVFRPGVSV